MNKNILKNNYRPEIDGIRAIAVITVIIYHFNKNLIPSGFLGVDIFFVISGYVITASLARRESKNFVNFLSDFYKRRIKRLLPPLILFVLIFSFLLLILVPQTGASLKTAIASLFAFSNIYLFNYSTDYFAQENDLNVFMHTWSLGVEEQFYLIFPFLVYLTGFSKKNNNNSSKKLLIIIIFLSVISLISFIYSYQNNESAAYFLPHNRFWEIAMGCITFLLIESNSIFIKKIEKIPNILLITLIISIFFVSNNNPTLTTILIVSLTSLLINCLKDRDLVFEFLTNKVLIHIGLISYSLYLWHWGIISLSRWTIGIHWWSIPFQITLIYFFAKISYSLIEKPIKDNSKFKNNKIIYGVAISSLISSASLIYLFSKPLKGILYLGNKENIYNFSERKYWNFKKCKAENNLLSNESLYRIYNECWVTKNGLIEEKNLKNRTIFVYGNSYNAMMMPIFAELVKNNSKININSFYRVGCMSSIKIKYFKDGIYGSCADTFKNYLQFFRDKSKKGDSLLIMNSYNNFMKDSSSKLYVNNSEVKAINATNIYIQELKELSKILKLEGKSLFITSPIPAIKNNPLLCSSFLTKTNKKCSPKNGLFNDAFNREISSISSEMMNVELEGISYLDINNKLKDIVIKDITNIYSYYSDKEHLTRKGALSLKGYFKTKILNK